LAVVELIHDEQFGGSPVLQVPLQAVFGLCANSPTG
jgi:hypothetical protein